MRIRESVVHGFQQVVHFLPAEHSLLLEILVMVQIGGANHRHPFPGVDEHGSMIPRVDEGQAHRNRQFPERKDKVAATQRADALFGPELAPQQVRPGPGGMDDVAGAELVVGAGKLIMNRHTSFVAIPGGCYGFGTHVVERPATGRCGLLQDAQYQAGVICHRIGKAGAAAQSLAAQPRHPAQNRLAREEPARAALGQKVVDPEQKPEQARPGELAIEVRHDVVEVIHQAGSLIHHALAFVNGIPRKTIIPAGQVTQATVDHLGGSAGCAPGEVTLFHQQSAVALPGSFTQDAGAGNAAADDHHVPGLIPTEQSGGVTTFFTDTARVRHACSSGSCCSNTPGARR